MADEPEDFSTIASGYTQDRDRDNNRIPDYQQPDPPLDADGEKRDANGEIIPAPTPIRLDPDTVDTSPGEREYRDDTRALAASFSPSHSDSRADPERENVARINKSLTKIEQTFDSQIRGPKVHADHLLALMVSDQKNRLRDTRKRHSRRSLAAQVMNPVRRDPTDSGLHLLAGVAKGFALGWKHSSARSLAMRTLKDSRLSQLVEFGHRHGLSDKVLEEMDKIQKDFSKRFQVNGDEPVQSERPTSSAPASEEPGTHKPSNATEPEAGNGPQAAENARSNPSAGDPLAGPAASKNPDPGSPDSDSMKGEPEAKNTGPAGSTSAPDPASRPFRQPWPYNPDLVDRVASAPEKATTDELIDAYASAKAELLMMQRLELRLRASASGKDEKELAKLPIAEQKKVSGVGLPREQFKRMGQVRTQSAGLRSQLKSRGFAIGPLERQIHARTQKLPLTVPGVDPALLLKQAVGQRQGQEPTRAHPMNIDLTGVKIGGKGLSLAPKPAVPTSHIAGAVSVINALFKQARSISAGLGATQQHEDERSR